MILLSLTNSDLHALIDDIDWDLCMYSWNLGNWNYVRRNNKPYDLLHINIAKRINLLGEIDHKNRDPLDCTRNNLRQCTHTQNSTNTDVYNKKNKTSIFKGVHWHIKSCKYVARITINGLLMHLGYFNNEIDAAKEYDKNARLYFKEFAVLNFPEKLNAKA